MQYRASPPRHIPGGRGGSVYRHAKMDGMDGMDERSHDARERTHDERARTDVARDDVQIERAPDLLTYAEAGARMGLTPNAVRMRCSRGSIACAEGEDGGRHVVWPQPERTPDARTRTRTHGERTHDARTHAQSERAPGVQAVPVPDERDATIATLEAQLAEVRNHVVYVERLADDRGEEVRRLIDAMQEQAIALRAVHAAAIPATVMEMGATLPDTRTTHLQTRGEEMPPRVGAESLKPSQPRPWWKFWSE